MHLEFEAFATEHLDAAAELVAERQRAHRTAGERLSRDLEEPAVGAAALRVTLQQRSSGVVAMQGNRLVGFLFGSLIQIGKEAPLLAAVPYGAVALIQESGVDTYRELYAAAAERWAAEQCYTHSISFLAVDQTARDALLSLGLGHDTVTGIRDVGPMAEREPADLEIRRGRPADVEAIVRLEDGLRSYQSGSPIFIPYGAKRRADMPALHERSMADNMNAYWIAFRQGVVAGYLLFAPVPKGVPHLPDGCVYIEHAYTVPGERKRGVATALLNRGLSWAHEAGYEYCATDWLSASLLGSRFWPRQGFRPTSYQFRRRLREQIE